MVLVPKFHLAPRHAEELLKSAGANSVLLSSHGTLQVKIYAPRGIDDQRPHGQDEIYVVIRGAGTFLLAGQEIPFAAGDFLFAPAGVEHRFQEFTEDFSTWVFFYGPEGGESYMIAEKDYA